VLARFEFADQQILDRESRQPGKSSRGQVEQRRQAQPFCQVDVILQNVRGVQDQWPIGKIIPGLKNNAFCIRAFVVSDKTWTTDAIYLETASRIKARRSEGCVKVKMEASAFFAIAQLRRAISGQILYAGDDASGIEWDPRDFFKRGPICEQIFRLAAEACLQL
jgi:hypothetical protein